MNRSCWVEDTTDVIKDGFDFHLSEHQQLSSSQLKTFGLKLVTITYFVSNHLWLFERSASSNSVAILGWTELTK